MQSPKPLRPPPKLGEAGGDVFQSVLHHEGENVLQWNRLGIEPIVLLVEVLERQGGGQDGVDEVEEFGLAGEQLILDLLEKIGPRQRCENRKGREAQIDRAWPPVPAGRREQSGSIYALGFRGSTEA